MMDKFIYTFGLSSQQKKMIDQYASPATESSIVKGVPLDRVDEIKRLIRLCSPGRRVDVKYRGPRYDWLRSTCLKCNARSAAIYVY